MLDSKRHQRRALSKVLQEIAIEKACTITEAKRHFAELPQAAQKATVSAASTYVVPRDRDIHCLMFHLANTLNAMGVPARVTEKDKTPTVTVKGFSLQFYTAEPVFCLMSEDGTTRELVTALSLVEDPSLLRKEGADV